MSSTKLTASIIAFGKANSPAKLIADKIRYNLHNSSAIQLFLIAGISLAATNAVADNLVWDGETDTNWVNGTNWVGDAAPDPFDNVSITGNGVTVQPIISGGITVTNVNGIIGEASGSDGTVEVTGAGSTWTNTTGLFVGQSGTGELIIANGGSASNTIFGIIGHSSGGDGTVEVTGAGSTWTNYTELDIAQSGTGELTIADGGAVSSELGFIGASYTGDGTVLVTGASSIWSNSSELRVGYNGTADLTIADGGAVNNTRAYIGENSGGNGTVEVTGVGSTWTNRTRLYVGDSGTGELTIADGGVVNNSHGSIGDSSGSNSTVEVTGVGSTWTNSETLNIGRSGTGALTIANGGAVSNTLGYVGNSSSGDGTVEVTGAGSTWTNSETLEIGRNGTGKLTIADGGSVSNAEGNIGHNSGSDGTIEVTGTGSTWTNSSGLDVGDSGTGELTIADGGTVSNTAAFIGHISSGDGTVEVTGTDSSWTNSATLYVGYEGTGKLTIADGGSVSNARGEIGSSSGGDGTVEVTGTDSTWTNFSHLYIGNVGTGKLTVADGGVVSIDFGYIGSNSSSDGTVEVTGMGSTLTSRGTLGIGDGGNGDLTIADAGVVKSIRGSIGADTSGDGTVEVTGMNSNWTNSDFIYVGLRGTGKLTIVDGGAVSNTYGHIGGLSGSDGTVEVTGMNSNWTNSSDLYVGDSGTGKLTLANGGTVSNTAGNIGRKLGSEGTVEVTGAGSIWTNSEGLTVGNEGSGELTIADGGAVGNTEGNIGYSSGSEGTVEVTGADSTWTNSAGLFVGRAGTGKMTVSNGGVVSNTDGLIGIDYFSDGTVEVTGTNSSWTNSLNLYVGYKGTAKLNVSNGGSVNANGGAGNAFLGFSIGSNGTINIGAAPMDAAIAAGTLNASNVEFGEGIGTLNFNHTDNNYQFAPDLSDGSGTSALNHYAGFTNLTGTINLSATPTTIYGGTLAIDQATSTFGAMSVRNGGLLDLANNMNVGDAISINGNFEALTGSTLSIDVNHLNQSDTLTVNGTVALGNELSVIAKGVEANYVLPEYEYLIIDNDGTDAVSGTFSGLTTNYAFLEPTVEYDGGDGNDVILTLNSTAADFQPFAHTPNHSQTAAALNDVDYSSPDGIEVFGAFINLLDSQVPNVLDQLGGSALIAPTYLGGKANKSVIDQLNTLLSVGGGANGAPLSASQSGLLGYGPIQDDFGKTEVFAGMGYNKPSTTNDAAPNAPNGLWTRMFGVRSQVSSDGNSPTINSEQYGILLGADFAANADGLMGLVAGYSRGTYATNSVGGVSNSDNFHIAGYGKFGASNPNSTGFGLSGIAAYTYQKFDTERLLSFAGLNRTATANYNSASYGAELRARFGYDKDGMIVAPFGELSYQNMRNEAFSETGAGTLNLSAAATSHQHLTGGLGIEFAKSTQHAGRTHRVVASVAWSHEFLDTGLSNQFTMASTPNQFSISSPDEARDSLKLGLGIDFALNDIAVLQLGVRTNLSSTSTEYGASAAFKMNF